MTSGFSKQLKSKLPNVGTTIFSVMSKMAQKEKAINLSQGFPDFPIDSKLSQLVSKAMKDGFNQYAPMPGLAALRETISEKLFQTYTQTFNPDSQITVTAGATQAIFTAISALVNPGDEVIIFSPAYDCYAPAIELYGGVPVYVNLESPNYKPDWDEVEERVNLRTRLIIINTPHNPTGTILGSTDMLRLEKIVCSNDLLVLSDEVYEHIIFDEQVHQSVALFPDLMQRSLVVASFGKTFHVTGWKMGYIFGPEYLIKEFKKVHQYVVFSTNTPVQVALSEYLKHPENYTGIAKMYEQKRDLFLSTISESLFTCEPSQGTYFQLLSYKNLSDQDELKFAKELTSEHKVASIPISAFYSPELNQHTLRFCFAKSDETLIAAGEILSQLS